MSSAPSEFDSLANAILAAGGSTDPSELHGFVCGLLATGATPDKKRWQDELAQLLELDAVPADLNQSFLQLADTSNKQLQDRNFDFQLLLSDEAEDITARTQSLGHWCQGFLHGFGVGAPKGDLSPTSNEALQDLSAIAQVDAEELDSSDETENHLLQVEEFVRVAVLNIFIETAAAAGQKSANSGPTVH